MGKKILNILSITVLLFSTLFGVFGLTTVHADEVTNFTDTTTITTASNTEITSDTTVVQGQSLDVRSHIVFPDSQSIKEGDTLTLRLPQELRLFATKSFDVSNKEGIKLGTAIADASTGTVKITFTNHFTVEPNNKFLDLDFNVTVNTTTVTTKGEVYTFTFGGKTFQFTYGGSEGSGSGGTYEYKYGYQAKDDPTLIRWKIMINSVQDVLRSPVITDTVGPNQVIEGRIRVVRLKRAEGVASVSESMVPTLKVEDAYPVDSILDANGNTVGFTVTDMKRRGIILNSALWIEYSTRIPANAQLGDVFTNTVAWTADNFPSERKITKTTTLTQRADGAGGSDTTTTEETTTSETATTTESTTSEATTTTAESTTHSEETTTSSEKKGKVLPNTGESGGLMTTLVGVVLLVAIGAGVFFYRKSKKN